MARKHRTEQEHQLALSDEAAAYIADALMQLATKRSHLSRSTILANSISFNSNRHSSPG
jgi:hypothetical protein